MKIYLKELLTLLAGFVKEKRGVVLVLCVILMPLSVYSQKIAIKTNALEWATVSPNISAEFVVSPTMSLDLSASFNGWTPFANAKFDHLRVQPELRYWFQRPMAQHFIGFTLLYIDYDMMAKGVCHDGQGVGGGFTYGYDFVLSKRWNIELAAGIGALYRTERKYDEGSAYPETNNLKGWCLIPVKLGVTVSCVIF